MVHIDCSRCQNVDSFLFFIFLYFFDCFIKIFSFICGIKPSLFLVRRKMQKARYVWVCIMCIDMDNAIVSSVEDDFHILWIPHTLCHICRLLVQSTVDSCDVICNSSTYLMSYVPKRKTMPHTQLKKTIACEHMYIILTCQTFHQGPSQVHLPPRLVHQIELLSARRMR